MNLIIRLYLPNDMGPDSRRHIFDAKSCYPKGNLLYREMVLAGYQLAKARPSMTGVRIAFRRGGPDSIVVADCKEEIAYCPLDSIGNNDGTPVEGPWEDGVELQRHGFSIMSLLPPGLSG